MQGTRVLDLGCGEGLATRVVAQRGANLTEDLPRQLLEWLLLVNEERPSRATKVIPSERLAAERERMRSLAVLLAEYGLRFPVQVGPTALVDFQGVRYAMPAGACGIPAILHLYPDRVRISTVGGRFEATHPSFPKVGRTSYLEGQRAEQLAAVAGARKRLYFMRERLLELGPVGEGYLTELIHACVFRSNPSTDSGRKRPRIPAQAVHAFRSMSSTDSGQCVRSFRPMSSTPDVPALG